MLFMYLGLYLMVYCPLFNDSRFLQKLPILRDVRKYKYSVRWVSVVAQEVSSSAN